MVDLTDLTMVQSIKRTTNKQKQLQEKVDGIFHDPMALTLLFPETLAPPSRCHVMLRTLPLSAHCCIAWKIFRDWKSRFLMKPLETVFRNETWTSSCLAHYS